MAVTMFVVRATITKDREAAFNKWYNEEHAPQVLASEAVFKRFQESDHLKTLIKDYNANFGEVSDRERSAYVQIWP